MTPLKVLISGGGVAGPALASFLSRTGANVTLIERKHEIRASGQQVDLRGQGMQMLAKMGIEDSVRAAGVPELGMQLVDRGGQPKAFFRVAPKSSQAQSFTSAYEIMRGDLVKILYRLTEKHENVKHLFDTTLDSFTQDDETDPHGKVHVRFGNGKEEDFDLVVGADGAGSRTRKVMLGPGAVNPRHSLGGYVGYFSIPSDPKIDEYKATFYHLPGSRVIGTRKDCDELTRVYIIMRGKHEALAAALKVRDITLQKSVIKTLYQGGGWQCHRFLEALTAANDLYCTPIEQIQLPRGSWSRGRVALLGDAAYGHTASGYGCAWSLAGAYILAGEITTRYKNNRLSSTAAVVQGAKKYEEIFRPIATAPHGGNWWLDRMRIPKSSFGIGWLHRFAKAAAYLELDRAAGPDKETAKWQLPYYPELEDGQFKTWK